MTLAIHDLSILRPKHELSQEGLFDWIAHAHVQSESLKQGWTEASEERALFQQKMVERLATLGLGKEQIETRSVVIPDCLHKNWEEMEIYPLSEHERGSHLSRRMRHFEQEVQGVFEEFYRDTQPPGHLIHVTCTGYVSPSSAQLIATRTPTMVTHAYHMGCYASIPALRMAVGHWHTQGTPTDIVHTELASLHMDPSRHTTEQLVVQGLFADGFAKYTVGPSDKGLAILSLHEQLVPDSATFMNWSCGEFGFYFLSLTKEVPVVIGRALEGYLLELCKKAKIDIKEIKNAHYAIHPGGPKIIEQTAKRLEIGPDQYRHSKYILKKCGNMSSATLPHVWERMMNDPQIKKGELIVSLAFGPGLSIAGGIFEKL